MDDLKTGKRDCVPVWMDKNGRTVLVTYMAVRDKTNHYLGTVELVQDMEFAKEHFQK
ncbi:MAG: PAS domain-containing protein [Lachnospiraceae bacterium]